MYFAQNRLTYVYLVERFFVFMTSVFSRLENTLAQEIYYLKKQFVTLCVGVYNEQNIHYLYFWGIVGISPLLWTQDFTSVLALYICFCKHGFLLCFAALNFSPYSSITYSGGRDMDNSIFVLILLGVYKGNMFVYSCSVT